MVPGSRTPERNHIIHRKCRRIPHRQIPANPTGLTRVFRHHKLKRAQRDTTATRHVHSSKRLDKTFERATPASKKLLLSPSNLNLPFAHASKMHVEKRQLLFVIHNRFMSNLQDLIYPILHEDVYHCRPRISKGFY